MNKRESVAAINDSHVDFSAERELWLAVIAQAVTDAFSPGEKELLSARAMLWFINNSKNYKIVCDYANVEPGSLRKTIVEKIHVLRFIVRGTLKLPENLKRAVIINNRLLMQPDIWHAVNETRCIQGIHLSLEPRLTAPDIHELCFLRHYMFANFGVE